MNQERLVLYEGLEREIGNTPLYENSKIKLPRENRVFAKEENKNPGGSHYDRVFIALFKHYEESGEIIPGYTPVVETTSGSAGVSFARLGRILGYECLVVCPENLPTNRLNAISEEGANLRLTPGKKYVNGSAEELGRIFKVENKERKTRGKVPYFGLNHTQGEAADISANSVEIVIDEAVKQAKQEYQVKFDVVIAAGGNGTTLLGFGRGAKKHDCPLVVWESLSSGLYLNKRFKQTGDKTPYEWKYGGKPESNHEIFGTVYGPTPYPLPNIEKAFEEGLIDNVRILSNEDTKKGALELTSNEFHRSNISRLCSWEDAIALLKDVEGKPVGRSSAGNLAMVLDTQWRIQNLNILTFFYDDLSRY
jgi:cysteine synthase|tara:strand:- start:832 stop:1926 length:1095 start_codon:yes stop_codon:yes gene_type:complete